MTFANLFPDNFAGVMEPFLLSKGIKEGMEE